MDELSFWLNFEPLATPVEPRPTTEEKSTSKGHSRARHMAGRNGRTQATAVAYSTPRRLSDSLDGTLHLPIGDRYQPRHRTAPLFQLPGLPSLPALPQLPSMPHPRIAQPALVAGSVAAVMAVTSLGLGVHSDGGQKAAELAADRSDSNTRAARSASLEERYPGIDLAAATATPSTTPPTTALPTTTTTAAPAPTTTTTTAKPKPTTTTTTAAPKKKADSGVIGDDVWTKLAQCEAGGRNDGGAPYYGYFQFSAKTWRAMGGTGLPNDHDYETQKSLAKKLQAQSGWGQWPSCSSKLGLR